LSFSSNFDNNSKFFVFNDSILELEPCFCCSNSFSFKFNSFIVSFESVRFFSTSNLSSLN